MTEPAEPSARILGLGLKQYPSNKQRMLNKDLTLFIQQSSYSWAPQIPGLSTLALAVTLKDFVFCVFLA